MTYLEAVKRHNEIVDAYNADGHKFHAESERYLAFLAGCRRTRIKRMEVAFDQLAAAFRELVSESVDAPPVAFSVAVSVENAMPADDAKVERDEVLDPPIPPDPNETNRAEDAAKLRK